MLQQNATGIYRLNNKIFALLILTGVLMGGLLIAGISNNWFGDGEIVRSERQSQDLPEQQPGDEEEGKSLAESLGIPKDQIVEVGDVRRPKRDIADSKSEPSNGTPMNPIRSAGILPQLKGDENPQVAGLYAELREPKVPREAASAMFLPEEFNKDDYLENPEEYLNAIRPGRVFQPAQPGPNVAQIAEVSNRKVTLLQGEKAVLRVQAEPDFPVTFYVQAGGEFENRLKSISVAANEQGIAEATYSAVSGTHGIIRVLASSPVRSGIANFAVKVVLPEQ